MFKKILICVLVIIGFAMPTIFSRAATSDVTIGGGVVIGASNLVNGMAPIARVHYYHAYPSSTVSVATSTSGDLFIASYSSSAIDVSSGTISDTLGNSWHFMSYFENGNQTLSNWYAANIIGSSSPDSVTVSSTDNGDPGLTVTEYSGISTSTPFFNSACNSVSTNSSPNSYTWMGNEQTSTTPNQLWYSSWASEVTTATSWNTPFTAIQNDTNHADTQADDLNVPYPGSPTASVNINALSGHVALICEASFNAASSTNPFSTVTIR